MSAHDVTAPVQDAAEAAAAAASSRSDRSSAAPGLTSASPLPPPSAFHAERQKQHMRRTALDLLGDMGSTQTRTNAHRPHKGRLDPVTARQLTVSHLMAATAHMGHNKSSLQRASAAFAYGTRHGQVIIDVERHTLPALRLAAKVVGNVVFNDGVVVFLGTAPNMESAVLAAAKRLGTHGFHVTKERWQPGTLTNAPKLLSRAVLGDMDTYQEEVAAQQAGRSSGSGRNGGGADTQVDTAKLASQTLQPDLIVVLNPKENLYAIREATQQGIPTIGIIDTDVDPRLVTYAIPANDDSLTAVELIVGVLSKAGQAAVQERAHAEDAADKRARRVVRHQRHENSSSAR